MFVENRIVDYKKLKNKNMFLRDSAGNFTPEEDEQELDENGYPIIINDNEDYEDWSGATEGDR